MVMWKMAGQIVAGAVLRARDKRGNKRRTADSRDSGRSPAITKTISMPLDLFLEVSDIAHDQGMKFSAAVVWLIQKGIAHEAIMREEQRKRAEEKIKQKLNSIAEEITKDEE